MTLDTQRIGQQAERFVANYLAQRGYHIIETNARIGRHEIDIIATRGRMLVFCEVRSRSRPTVCSPYETIGRDKIRRIRDAARAWITRHVEQGGSVPIVRLDVASVTWFEGRMDVEYFENAIH
jgi:putative endonuclease